MKFWRIEVLRASKTASVIKLLYVKLKLTSPATVLEVILCSFVWLSIYFSPFYVVVFGTCLLQNMGVLTFSFPPFVGANKQTQVNKYVESQTDLHFSHRSLQKKIWEKRQKNLPFNDVFSNDLNRNNGSMFSCFGSILLPTLEKFSFVLEGQTFKRWSSFFVYPTGQISVKSEWFSLSTCCL